MKRLLVVLWLLIGTATFAAVNVKIQWDAKSPSDSRTHVRIYERAGVAPPYIYTQVAEVVEPAFSYTLNAVPAGAHTYIARAWNGQEESGDSNPASTIILAIPGVVTNITITFTP